MKKLTDKDIFVAAKKAGIEPAILKSFIQVESRGAGFLVSGRPVILFEGHIFYNELRKRKIRITELAGKYPDIVYPRWTKAYYKGGEKEHERLQVAMAINAECALLATSWGLFQLMGFNFKACGFNDVFEFVGAMQRSEQDQLKGVIAFILQHPKLLKAIRAKEFGRIAYLYNGSAYTENAYDLKLKNWYHKYLNFNNFVI